MGDRAVATFCETERPVGVVMKYRPCLWCKEYFWATGTQVCCCSEHQEARNAEKNRKSKQRQLEREKRIKAKLLELLEKKGKA